MINDQVLKGGRLFKRTKGRKAKKKFSGLKIPSKTMKSKLGKKILDR